MDKLVKWLEDLIRAQKKSRAWRTFVSCLAAIVVFTTTYSLILPAITVESTATEDVGGLVMEGTDAGSTGAQAEASGEVVTVNAENEIPEEPVQEEVPAQETVAEETPAAASENETTQPAASQPAASQPQTVQPAESAAAVVEEVREPVNGEVQTIGDKRVMTLKGDDFDVVVSGDLSVGVSDGTVLSVRGIADADVAKSYSDRISDELLKIFVDKKTTEVLYQLVFTDKDLYEYAPTGYFDVQFIFHKNTVSHTGEKIYAAIYDYLTDEMVLAEKNGDEYETPVISLDEYGIIKGITLKGMHFDEYSDIITLVAGPVNKELKLAAEKATNGTAADSKVANATTDGKAADSASTDSKAESKTESVESKTEETESTGAKTDSAESNSEKTESTGAKADSAENKVEGTTAKAETSKESEAAESGTTTNTIEQVGETYTLQGGTSVSLKELLVALNVTSSDEADEFINSTITSVSFTKPEAVRIEKEESVVNTGFFGLGRQVSTNDYTITPLQLFEDDEYLVIEKVDGQKIYIKLDARGVEEVTTDIASISAADGRIMPADASASAEVIAGADAGTAQETVKSYVAEQKDSRGVIASIIDLFTGNNGDNENKNAYKVFDISLENVKEENFEEGFKVEINLPEDVNGTDYVLYHIHEGKIDELAVEVTDGKASFITESFSQFVLKYTVDFETVDGVKWSWPGEGSYSIASILAEIGVADPAKDVKLVRTVDEGGAENVLFLEEKEDGWYLTSEAAFRDTFVLSVAAGEKVYIITVTDASEVASNDGIKSLLTDVNITGAKNENGTYVVYPDQPYGIELSFKEVNKNNGQFPMSDSFTYQLPSGLVPYGSSVSNYLEVELSGGEHAGEKVKLNYTISQDGLITFRWDNTTSPAAYDQLKDSLYAQFRLELECTYTGDSGTLDFGNDITKDVTVKNNGTVNVNKTGKYNAVTNCVDYTVSVYSDGITKNVVITDTVSGSALTYNRDAVSSSSIHGKEVPSPTSNGNGFSLTIPQMADQETVTVKYSAAVNLDALHKNDDGSWGTFDETGNTVVVKSKDNQDVEDHTYGKDFENKISMSSVGKSGSPVEADETGHATVNWTIHANDNANVSMAGHTISDSISGNSVPMSYNSSGIHVVAYYADGSQAYDKDIVWGSDGLTKAADGQSWSWSVPNRAPDTQKLSYVITYTTDVDVSDRLIKTNVTNHAESDNGGTADYGVDVTPNGGALTARKKVVKTDITSKTVTWEINFDVPATGLNSAQIIDTMPTFWENGQVKYFDSYLGNSTITIIPELAAGESYEATTSADGRTLTIDFYKTEDEQKVTGLSATGSARKIRVQFQTEFNEDWLTAAEDHQNETNYTNHTNTGRVLLNGQTIGVSATTKVESNEPGMSKVHGAQTTYNVNGNSLPAFPYVVTLEGVTDDYFDDNGMLYVEDTFNGRYLAYYPETQNNNTGDNNLVGYLYGATGYQDLSNGGDPIHNVAGKSENKVVSSPSDGKILISISRDDIPLDSSGNYYPYYYIFYYLTVKDPIALEKLNTAIQQSDSGVYSLLNTVTNQKFGSTTDTAEFEIPVLDKTITSPNGKAYYNNGNWMVDFKLDVNPDALDLGDDEELTLTDDYTNLAVDYTTIKIQKEVNGSLVDTTDADGVSWNRKGNRITYTLQNGVHYVITYSARLTGEPGSDGKVHYDNTAEYFGVKKWTKGDQDIRTGGSGSSPTYGITVFKHEKGAGSLPLSGAKFKLYKYTETQDQENGWENQPSNAINTETRTPVDSGWEAVKEMTTDSDGVAKTFHSDNIQRWTWYMLIEQEAPVYEGSEHYQLKDFGYVFWITDKGVADYSHYVYLNDDVVAIDNEPPIPETVDIGVTKTWTNDNGDTSKRKDITVRLYADGVPYDDWTDKNGDHLDVRSDTVKVLSLNADGTTDGYTWTGLPGGPVYSVVEDGVAGYTTTYSPKNTQVSGTINIKNKYIPGKTFIHVEKNWSGVAQDSQAEDITVQLKRKVSANAEIRVVSNTGTMREHFPVPVGSVVNIDFAGTIPTEYQEQYAWWPEALFRTAYKDGAHPAWELYRGDTTAASALIDSGIAENSLTTEHGHEVHITGVTVGAEGLTLRFPGDYGQGGYDPNLSLSQTPQVTVTGGSGGTYTEDVNFNNENHYYTISAANGWKIDIDRLVKEDDDGKYIYYIEEVGVNDNTETPEEAGYTVTYENNDGIEGGTGNAAQDTIKVTNSPEPGSLEVTKTVSGTDAKGTYSIAVKDSNGHYYALDGTDKGTEAFYVSFSKDSTQKWNNLPAGTYTVEEQDASVGGYTWRVTGTGEVEVPVGGNAEAEVINIYEEKPASGSIKLRKSVTVNGETTSTNAADGDYTFTITGPDEATDTVATVTIKVTGGVATQYKLNNADTFTDLPADKYVVIPDLDLGDYVITESPVDGMAVSSITGGKTGTADKANRKVTVTVTADEVVQAEATAEFVNDVKQFKFKKVWLDSNDANANSVDWVKPITVELYGRKASAQDTKIDDYEVTYPATAGAAYTAELKTETIGEKTYKSYEITFSKLSADYDSFYVKEKGLDAYFTTYGTSAQEATTGQMSAGEGEYIINSLVTVELPSTGGPGTLLYSMLGMMLIAFAGTAYMILLRRRRASLKGGDNLR